LNEATPIHEWVMPRLVSLLRDAENAGIDRATVVAVITDLITSPPFNDTPPATEDSV
jgi:hypothetical protein